MTIPSARAALIAASLIGLSPASLAQAPPPGSTTVAPGAPARDPAASRPTVAKGTGVIGGRILAADTGLPLRRARVLIQGNGPDMPSGPGGIRAASTDADGAFAFTELLPGRYHLQAQKARYVDGMFGARRQFSSGRPIELAAGQRIEDVTLSLEPAGAISGRVLDDLGEPVAGARVQALRAMTVKGTRQLMAQGNSDETDDTGNYRLYGLPPGAYAVSARDDSMRMGFEIAASSAASLAPTYHPSTAVATDAQVIEIVAGGDAVADIALVAVRTTAVSGAVVNAAGAPAIGGHVTAFPSSDTSGFGVPQANAPIKPDGSFALSGLAPGEYTVQARPTFEPPMPFPSSSPRMRERRTVSTSITVAGEPITGLRLVLPDPITLPVVARFEDPTAKPPENVSVSAYSERIRDGSSAMRGPDGRLTLELAPGTWRFSAYAAPPWRAERLTYRGDEIEPWDDVEVTGEPGGRLEVTFTTRSATVTGSVKEPNGRPLTDYVVFVLPAEGDLTSGAGYGRFSMTRPDQTGRFKAEHLRPGAYVAVAVEDLEPTASFDGEVLERLRKAGTPLRVREGESTAVELTLTTLP